MFPTIASLLALPVVCAVAYVAIWPGVAARPVATALVGIAIGLLASLASIYWSVVVPLSSVGISGANAAGGSSITQLVTGRAAIAGSITLVATIVALVLASRIFGSASQGS